MVLYVQWDQRQIAQGWGLTQSGDAVPCVGKSIPLVPKEEEETKLAKGKRALGY